MKKNNIITTIFIILFFIILSSLFGGEYIEKNKSNYEIKENISKIENNLKDFHLEKIKELDDVEIYNTPFLGLIDKIVTEIDNAKELVYIESYIFTEKRIKESIKNAHKRGIEIKIIMEKNPYMANNINNNFYNEFEKKGIDVVWSNKKNYLLNHTKTIIIDDLSIILTGNISYSTFSKNRDFLIFTKDNEINNKLKELFLYDYNGEKKSVYHENIVLSPIYSRLKIEKMIDAAENDIKIYIQYFNDEKITNKLIKLKKDKNLNITAIIRSNAKDDLNTKKLINAGVNIKVMTKNDMHSKAILIDNKYLFIGSVNFSEQSFDENRELGIIIKNKNVINNFLEQFNKDLTK